jgi:hypothetical protein
MKNIFIVLLYITIFTNINAQWVTIPDSNFVIFLHQNYPQCMSGNEMDTTCTAIILEDSLNCSSKFIQDISGIEYFKNLETLICDNNFIDSIFTLPVFLKHLSVSRFILSYIQELPPLLEYLDCSESYYLSSLPPIPASLKYLNIDDNQFTILPNLPNELVGLHFSSNQISSIPSLPDSLISLDCGFNQLTSLPSLPKNLSYLICRNNQISYLPPFPPFMFWLECQYNQITSISTLPDTMFALRLHNNPISCLPSVSFIWWSFSIDNTNIQCLPNVITEIIWGNVYNGPLCDMYNPNGCEYAGNIKGKVYFDSNLDCKEGIYDVRLKNIKLELRNGGNVVQQTLSNDIGRFFFNEGQGSYTVKADTTDLPFSIHCPSNNLHNFNIIGNDTLKYKNDFAVQCKGGFDVGVRSIVRTDGNFIPADTSEIKISAGDMAEFYGLNCANGINGTVSVNIQGPVNYLGSSSGALSPIVSGNNLIYNINDFGLINDSDFKFLLLTDNSAQVGDTICIEVMVFSLAGDNNTSNNSLKYCFTISNNINNGNYKEIFPLDIVSPGDWVFYTIHFQNPDIGSVQHFYITDTLNPYLNASTFTLLSYSHQPVMQIIGNVVKFNFPHLNLPDSISDFINSKGYVQFKIKVAPNAPIGTIISNSANNYFDFVNHLVTNMVNIEVDCPFVPTIYPSTVSLCPGEQDTLWTEIYDNYQWFKDGLVVPGATQQFFYVNPLYYAGAHINVLVSSNGCIKYSDSVFVNTFPAPPTPVITLSGSNLTTQTGYTYQWYLNGNPIAGNTNTIQVQGPGSYTVTITDNNGCSETSAAFVITSIIESLQSGSVSVIYNNGLLQINRSITNYDEEIFVLDITGRIVANTKLAKGISQTEIQLNGVAPGIYFVKINDASSSVKFFVE